MGVFIGVAPTFGLGMFLAAGLSAALRLNMAAAVLGAVAGAPPVIPFIWIASCHIGAMLLGLRWEVLYAQLKAGGILSAGGSVLIAYLIGNVILTAALTGLSYLVTVAVLRRRAGAPEGGSEASPRSAGARRGRRRPPSGGRQR